MSRAGRRAARTEISPPLESDIGGFSVEYPSDDKQVGEPQKKDCKLQSSKETTKVANRQMSGSVRTDYEQCAPHSSRVYLLLCRMGAKRKYSQIEC